jgi:putative phosphotransacetylase
MELWLEGKTVTQAIDEATLVRLIAKAVSAVQQEERLLIPVGISNRHVHLSRPDIEALFGSGYQMRVFKALGQPGQCAYEETVTLVGPKGAIPGVRVLGPPRESTQVEISMTDGYTLGINPPLLESGLRSPTPTLSIVGPRGAITCSQGVICALRHLHMSPPEAAGLGIKDGDTVSIRSHGDRALVFNNVRVRVREDFKTEFHIDVDEARAGNIKNGEFVELLEG